LYAGGSCIHGITKFADLTQAEFEDYLLGWTSDKDDSQNAVPIHAADEADINGHADKTKTSADWVGIYTTPIKDQGYCGSCWAFSATEQIESDSIIEGILTTSTELSPQQIVSWYVK
jgi:C1A family cysteine protease